MNSNEELFNLDNDFLSLDEAAKTLNVSEATIRNWIKLGTLKTNYSNVRKGNNSVSRTSVLNLLDSVKSGTIEKLNKRANKKHNSRKRYHSELDNTIIARIQSLEKLLKSHTITDIIISLALSIQKSEESKAISGNKEVWLSAIKNEIKNWIESVKGFKLVDLKEFDELTVGENEDLLGKVYQNLSLSSSKAKAGAFYTPRKYASEMVKHNHQNNDSVADPCCGSGVFLTEVLKAKILNKEKNPLSLIYGIDIDDTAVRICRINLILTAKSHFNGILNVHTGDSIELLWNSKSILPDKIDFVVTNPPWGSDFNPPSFNSLEALKYSQDSFSVILIGSMLRLSDRGRLSFLLPESFLNVGTYSSTRKKILSDSSYITVSELGKVFSGLLTNVVRLDLAKIRPTSSSIIKLHGLGSKNNLNQAELLNTKDCNFVFNVTSSQIKLLKTLMARPHTKIGDESIFALGIVTGNNKLTLKDSPTAGYEPIIRGEDIVGYTMHIPEKFIKFDKNAFQQCANEDYYRASEKLIYRFISNKLIISYDNSGLLTLNSSNLFIPKCGVPVKTILAILQSKVSQFVFSCQFSTIKILKKHIQAMPIFIFDESVNKKINEIVNLILKSKEEEKNKLQCKLDALIYSALNLDENEIKIIEEFLLQ